jgi:hypothetical protein
MTCNECRDVMLEVVRHLAPPSITQAVLAHTAGCPACGARFAQQSTLTAGLRAVAADADGRSASADVEARLMAAFAAQHGAGPTSRASTSGGRRWLLRAATVVLCAGAAAWWLQVPPRVADPSPQAAHATQPSAPLTTTSPGLAAANQPQGPRPVRAARARRKPARQAGVQAVGFVPLPSAAGLPDFESGEIVRLGIPVTALPNYGLEIPSGTQSAVQADLLIGQDGQARAIRLVNVSTDDPHPRR